MRMKVLYLLSINTTMSCDRFSGTCTFSFGLFCDFDNAFVINVFSNISRLLVKKWKFTITSHINAANLFK